MQASSKSLCGDYEMSGRKIVLKWTSIKNVIQYLLREPFTSGNEVNRMDFIFFFCIVVKNVYFDLFY